MKAVDDYYAAAKDLVVWFKELRFRDKKNEV